MLDTRSAALMVIFGLTACGGTEPGTQPVSVMGAITLGGQPAAGTGSVVLGVEGRNEPVNAIFGSFDGTYGISGEVDASDCDRLFVSVTFQNALGQVSGAATESLDSCGTHVVDLALS